MMDASRKRAVQAKLSVLIPYSSKRKCPASIFPSHSLGEKKFLKKLEIKRLIRLNELE